MLDTLIKKKKKTFKYHRGQSILSKTERENELHFVNCMHLIKDLACSAQDPCAHSRLLWIHPQASPRESAGGKLGIKGNRAAQAHASSLCHSMSLYLTLLGEHPSPHLWSASSDSKDCIYFIPHKTSSLFVGHRNRDFRAKMSCYDSRVLSAREHRLSANH